MLAALGARVHEIHPLCPAENVSLHAASELGDPELLWKVLKLSAKDINAHDPVAGLTPLAFALRGRHLDAARMLLEAGAQPEKANVDGSLPLVGIAIFDMADAMQLLLDHGAPVDQKDSKGLTALRNAAITGNEAALKLLLACGTHAHQVDDMGRTVLFDAVSRRRPSIVNMLLDHGLYIDHRHRSGSTVLGNVAQWGTVEMAQILLARGADQKRADCMSRIPLMIAAEYGNVAVLELLLPGARQLLDSKDTWGNIALHLAAEEGRDAAVKTLIESGANFRLTNTDGNTALALAARKQHIQTMAVLLNAEQDLIEATKSAHGMLEYAVQQGKALVVEFLLGRGIDVDDETRKLAKDPLVAEMLLHASLLNAQQAGGAGNSACQPLDGFELMSKLLDTAVRNKNADSWSKYLTKRHVSPTLSTELDSAAGDTRAVWKCLAGVGQKITPAQQKNWCAGILADLGNTMLRESPYLKSGLTLATRTVLETIARKQTQAMETAAAAAEQPLREGMANLLENCRKAVSDDQFYPLDLFKLLTEDHGNYHGVASLIVSAFSDVWPRRNSLGDTSLERAFADKLNALKGSQKALKDMNSGTAKAGNQATVNMLMFRQLDLLQGWIDKWRGS